MDGAALKNFAEDDTWGDQPFGAPMPRAFRLVDAERIAAHRLEGAAEGSLKEALATVIVTPEPKADSLGERLQQIAPVMPTLVPDVATPQARVAATTPPAHMMAEADFTWFGAAPPAHAVPCFEERDFGDSAMSDAPPTPAPAIAQIKSASVATSDSAHDAAHSANLETPDEIQTAAAVPAPEDEATSALPLTPPLALPEDPNLEPLVTAYAASARLAADAAAASQALFELQKLLNEQRLEASPELNSAMEAHALESLDAIPAAQPALVTSEVQQEQPRPQDPVTDAGLAPPRIVQAGPIQPSPQPAPQPLAATPPPLRQPPLAAVPAAPSPARFDTPQRPQVRSAPAGQPRTAPPANTAAKRPGSNMRPRAQRTALPRAPDAFSTFDLRGFAAGFVLSGAIGVVLYFVMATG